MREDLQYYLSLIEGNFKSDISLFINEPLELRKGLIIDYAFEQLVEIGDKSILSRLVKYMDSEIDIYNYKRGILLSWAH